MLADKYSGCNAIAEAHLISDPGSAEFFNTIRRWIEECTRKHAPCIRAFLSSRHHVSLLPRLSNWQVMSLLHEKPPLPARVLDVGRSGNDTVCLIETQGERADYITLSHCWGSVQPLKTTTATLQSRKHGIEWSMLPKTFQDVITITRGLGIKYIWIDSLCILQDDDDDWVAEAGNVGAIYENSWLTIAATAASDSTVGCFYLPPRQHRLSKSEQDKSPVMNQQAIYVRQSSKGFHEGLKSHYDPQPLMGRAWVFQERLLARRVLYICGEEMVWECSSKMKCECLQEEEEVLGISSLKHCFSRIIYNEVNHPSTFIEAWDGLLHRYLLQKLTYQKDRLPAIFGIAKKFGSTRSGLGKFVAGLWEAWLLGGLL
jgi:hypothetical protein